MTNVSGSLLALLLIAAGLQAQQGSTQITATLLSIEDTRRRDSAAVTMIRTGLGHASPDVRIRALRTAARNSVVELGPDVVGLLNDSAAGVRIEAANSIAQLSSVSGSAAVTPEVTNAWVEALVGQTSRESGVARGAQIRSLSRMPLRSAEQVQKVYDLAHLMLAPTPDSGVHVDALLAIERLSRAQIRIFPLPAGMSVTLRQLFLDGASSDQTRRLAFTALNASGAVDLPLLAAGIRNSDEQVRRVSVGAIGTVVPAAERLQWMVAMSEDPHPMVRLEVTRLWARAGRAVQCTTLVKMLDDPAPIVVSGATVTLSQSAARCPPAEAQLIASALEGKASQLMDTTSRDGSAAARIIMHRGAHTLLALARVSPQRAREIAAASASHPHWVARLYVVRAALLLNDSAVVSRLASDRDPNVKAAALDGIARLFGHSDDSVFIEALSDNHSAVIMSAASALRETPLAARASTALFDALARITAERRETSRDARVPILQRLADLASPSDSARLFPLLSDFDPIVAARAATLLSTWTGRSVQPSPSSAPVAGGQPLDVERLRNTRLLFTMSRAAGGGTFELELLAGEAPYSAARVVQLAERQYYDGLTFHRIAPNFVAQGGSPGANEYVGDGPFMRDELWLHSHARGTVGISTRGRDTGDAQIFINLIDSPRLDFDYTVFARVISGMATVDGLLEGDVIERVEVRGR